MANALTDRWNRWCGEWRANRRLRFGGIAIVAILVLYSLLVLNDWRHALAQEYQDRTLHLYKIAALAKQSQWPARAQEARNIRQALEAQIPGAATIGLAQAEVQTGLNQILRDSGQGIVTESRPPTLVDAKNGVWKIPVTVRGTMSSRTLVEVLRRLESGDRLVVIEEANLDNQRVMTVTVTVAFFYRIGARSERGGAANARP